MRGLQIFNVVVLATGASMGLVLAVVCVLYAANLELDAALAREMPALLEVTAWFLALAAAAALAFLGHKRNLSVRWPLQALPLIPASGLVLFARTLVS